MPGDRRVGLTPAREIGHRMCGCSSTAGRGFSLIELVIVVVIIGIIGAIAVPRMSRGAQGASDSSVTADLAVIRNALDLYAAEHNGSYPVGADMPDALLEYSNAAGDDFSTAKDTTHVFGPYLRAIPRLPVGANKGKTDFVGVVPAATTANGGWYYNESTGQVRANCKDSETDDAGVKYNAY